MRNKTIDQSRLFAAFLVVVIHAPLPGVIGVAVESVARLAVPFFFMLSGYFAFGKDKASLKRQISKIFNLFLFAIAINFAGDFLVSLYKGNTFALLAERFSVSSILKMIVFNNGPLLGHIWFLLALVYVYVIYSSMYSKSRTFVRLAVCLFLLATLFVLREILRAIGVSDISFYIRNFLVNGIPFFLLGTLAAEYKERLAKIKPYVWFILGAVGALASIAERLVLGSCDMYFGTPLLACSFFVASIMDILPCNNRLAMLGQKYSRDIYVFHNVVIVVLNAFALLIGVLQNQLFLFIRPFVIVTACIIGLSILYKILSFKNKAVKD